MYNVKTKSDFWPKCSHYIMGNKTNLGSMFFYFSLVLNLAYIDYSLCRIWSVYMQDLLFYDHSNKCLFQLSLCMPRCNNWLYIYLWHMRKQVSPQLCPVFQRMVFQSWSNKLDQYQEWYFSRKCHVEYLVGFIINLATLIIIFRVAGRQIVLRLG